jgi:ABC-2 type transport system permease protein
LQADLSVPSAVKAQRGAGIVVLRETARKAVRSGALWGYIFGIVVASSAVSYERIYKTQTERDQLATAFGTNKAAAALFGPAVHLDTVAGFTVFKSIMTLIVLGAIWGLLTSTRLLRGEEDAGRWELLLAGQTTQTRATIQAVGGLAVGVAALWVVTAVIIVLTGQYSKVGIAPGPMLYFSLALTATPVMFLACGVLTSQLASTRRKAATYAAWFLGVSYALRMVADAGVGLHGLIWVSPLGWAQQLQPLTSPQPLALLPIASFTAVVTVFAVRLASRRDAGAGLLADHASARPRLRLLSSPLGLTLRLERPTFITWSSALAATGLVLGLIAEAGGTISGSSVKTVFSRLGAPGTGTKAFLGVSFLIVAVLAAFMAAGQVTACRAEEAEGHLEHLLVRPVSRSSWLVGRASVAVGVLLAVSLLTGVTTWLGTVLEHSGVSLATLLNAGMNVLPPALCLFGIGILVFGAWPRATSYGVYSVLGWSLLVELVGGIGGGGRWLLDTSLFHQMAAAPAVSPDWTANALMIVVGAACAAVGGWAFRQRDLQGV